jgi:hypothetical protein
MAPDNFDNNIKNKLENRTIKPTEGAWIKLSEQLDTLDKKKPNTTLWFGIAASIVGVLFFILSNDENAIENTTPIIVDTQEKVKTNDSNEAIPSIENQLEQIELESNQVIVNTKEQAIPETKQAISPPEQNTIKPNDNTINTNISVAEVRHEPKVESDANVNLESQNVSFEDQKIQEVVAQIKDLQRDDKDITEAEIDQLLQQAENQINHKRSYDRSAKTVDASSLLQDVEMELEESFRDKVLEALKSSYESVKVAVIQRNE